MSSELAESIEKAAELVARSCSECAERIRMLLEVLAETRREIERLSAENKALREKLSKCLQLE